MEMDLPTQQLNKENPTSKTLKRSVFILNLTLLALGNCAGPLLLRLYFLRGGDRIWLSSWLETGGWPIMLIPLTFSYLHRRRRRETKLFSMTPFLFVVCTVLGVITGLDDYMYAYGLSYLPVSTSALLISSQLGFTAVFAFLIVRHKYSPYSVNAVVLLTVGAVILGLHTSGDRPAGVSDGQYWLGFILTIAAAALYGAVLPLIEWTYARAKQAITYSLVMEMQLVMSFFATVFCTVGMLVNKDFQAMSREAKEYELGEVKYYVIIVADAIFWQFFFLGTAGTIFCSSSLLVGVIIAVLIPVLEILGVIFFHEKFSAEKGVSLALSMWGFASYFYGEYNENKKKKKKDLITETEQPDSNK